MNGKHPAVYTHGHHESVLRSHRRRTAQDSAGYLLPYLEAGMSVLDVGCGPGTITVDLAARVAPGQVTAVERADDVLDLARAEVRERSQSNVSFATSDVHALDFPDDSFDVAHAHQVLQHVSDPVQALRELRRVCVPGGIVAVRDADYAGMIWFPRLPPLDHWLDLYDRAARANGGEPNAGRRLLAWAQGEPNAGRRLLAWAQDAGFDNITPTGSVWCFATPETRDWWGRMWADRIVESALARQLVDSGMAATADLNEISSTWREGAATANGWLAIPHGEIICRA